MFGTKCPSLFLFLSLISVSFCPTNGTESRARGEGDPAQHRARKIPKKPFGDGQSRHTHHRKRDEFSFLLCIYQKPHPYGCSKRCRGVYTRRLYHALPLFTGADVGVLIMYVYCRVFTVGYTMRDIRYKWNSGFKSVGISNEVQLPQFRVLGHRQRATEINLSTGRSTRA